jgi:sugar-specific transcriptional regulator TrmB
MPTIDLTPFGFTPTESAAYSALLETGPASGYAIAKHLSIARANGYQALNGLVAKHAAELTGEDPKVFRAVQPTALYARLSRDTARQLEVLEREVEAIEGAGSPDTVPFRGQAEFKSLLMRLAVRAELPVSVVAPSDVLRATLPVWRARAVNERPTVIVSIGSAEDFSAPVERSVDPDTVVERFGTVLTIVVAGSAAMLAHEEEGTIRGHWTTDPILVASARGATTALTG